MTNQEFRLKMRDLLPGCSEPAMESWAKYAHHLDTEDMIFEADFYDEIYVNLSLIKQHQGEQIARELFDYGEEFTFNSFELRGAAAKLTEGWSLEEISEYAVEFGCDATEEEFQESRAALKAFRDREHGFPEMRMK